MSGHERGTTVVIVGSSTRGADPDPWEPGGAMSAALPDAPDPAVRVDGDPSEPRGPRRRWRTVALVAILLATLLAILLAILIVTPVSSEVADRNTTRPRGASFALRTDSVIGQITWTRIVGDAGSLPERVVDGRNRPSAVRGVDHAGAEWRGSHDGRRWEAVSDADASRLVGGIEWRLRRQSTGGTLYRVVAGSDLIVPVDGPLAVAPPDWRVDVVPAEGPSSGFPIELGDELFVLARGAPVDVERSHDRWLRWDGERFENTVVPWTDGDSVDMVAVEDVVIAVASDSRRHDVRLWRTEDGRAWEAIRLPVHRTPGTAVTVSAGRDEARLAMSSDGLASYWSTVDGRRFMELPRDPGMMWRERGDFGFVVPDARGNPRVKVSADGHEWETVDLGGLLGFSASRWQTSITTHAQGDTIYVVATTGSERTLLLGTVAPH